MRIVKVFLTQLKRYLPMTGITSEKIKQNDMLAQVFIYQHVV